ncbi:hypothetical protein [Actinacidiphila glaucinigra]|uniref:hypothetical protein n=1 Tax=Actinacidiphila glaucinigra TaxID=235986 RepID=UPI00366C7F52
MNALTLLHLTFVGPDKETATVEFGPKLTVIYGASNTGKSFIAEAIDYMLGAAKLKEISEASGYTRILLGLRLAGGKVITLVRAPGANKIDVYNEDLRVLTAQRPNATLGTVHKPTSEGNISRYLLKIVGGEGRRIRTNASGKLRTLSLRDLAHLCVVHEDRMASPRSPVLASGQKTSETAEKSVFRFLLSGEDEADNPAGLSEVDKKIGKGKIALLDQLILDAQTSLTIEANESQLREQLTRLETSLANASATTGELVSQRSTVVARNRALEAQSAQMGQHTDEAQTLLARFGLLRKQYESDLARLQMVEEAGNILGYFRTETCVFCGAAVEHQQPGHNLDETSQLQAAVVAEIRKTNELHADLVITIEDLEAQLTTLDTEHTILRREVTELDRELANLDERLAPQHADVRELIAVRSQIQGELAIHAQIQRLMDTKDRLSNISPVPPPIRTDGVSASDLVEFERLIQRELSAWKIGGENRINYEVPTAELSVDDRKRSGEGKGVRSILHAALTAALARWCADRDMPHLGFVVLDSPVVTFRQPEDNDDDVFLSADVVDHFYRDLASNFPCQVVVIENKTPPADINDYARVYPFRVDGSRRPGLFPVSRDSTKTS